MALSSGTYLGPYQILAPIGAGGMGEVYRAHDPRVGRDVAIKVTAERFGERFDHEVRAIAALNHPNICMLHDVGPNYLVTELVEGETLRACFQRTLPMERSLEIARQVLEALRAAHQAGIVHRDLKPENVMVRFDGYVKVLDFGLAKRIPPTSALQTENTATGDLSLPGQMLGTVAYMSPEQIRGQQIDQRSDLFAFGTLLDEMIAARHPWRRTSPIETLHAILNDEAVPIPPTSPKAAELDAIIRRLLAKSPADRYPSAESVLEALASCASGETQSGARLAGSSKPLTSVAVLPFVFLSEVEESRALSLGFADALITILGNLEDVAVAPTAAILNYAPGTEPARVCRDLGVRHVLQGNVQKRGAQWRVSLQLFDAAAQKISFSEKYDFKLENVFEVQDEIGQRVVESLESRFPLVAPKSRDRYSSDPEAYDEFITGLRESYGDTAEVLESAAEHLSRAVEHDPEFALAHAWLSQVSSHLYFEFDPRRARLEKAEHHGREALRLDAALPEGQLARAWLLWSPAKNFQHAEAIAALEQALTAQPNLERAHNRMSAICWHIGRFHEARIAHARAERSNPRARTHNPAWIYLCSGDFAHAEEAARTWLREAPGNRYAPSFAAHCSILTGDLDLADQRLAEALRQQPDEPLIVSLQAMLHAWRKQTDLALRCVRHALDFPRSFGHTHHTYYQIACVYAVLGDSDKAMAWLERSVDTGFPCWPLFKLDPNLANIRQKPEFERLVGDLEEKYTALRIEKM